jgi:hypothetical protein
MTRSFLFRVPSSSSPQHDLAMLADTDPNNSDLGAVWKLYEKGHQKKQEAVYIVAFSNFLAAYPETGLTTNADGKPVTACRVAVLLRTVMLIVQRLPCRRQDRVSVDHHRPSGVRSHAALLPADRHPARGCHTALPR